MFRVSLILSVFAIFLVFVGAYVYDIVSGTEFREATGLVVSAKSFPVYLETHPLFDKLPEKANFKINFGDKTYAISKKGVNENSTIENSDFSVSLPDKYTSRIGEIGLCAALKEAVTNGELEFSAEASKFELFLRYAKLVKYRNCLA